MSTLKRYRSRSQNFVVAVQFNLDIPEFTYNKWGAEQRCKRGDWLVDNDGDVYSVDREVFARTYRLRSPGVYVKSSRVWGEVAGQDGSIATKEGRSHYEKGDYLVYNNEDRSDGYAMSASKFASLYELDE